MIVGPKSGGGGGSPNDVLAPSLSLMQDFDGPTAVGAEIELGRVVKVSAFERAALTPPPPRT